LADGCATSMHPNRSEAQMADVRIMLARLNPSVCRMEPGGSGKGELSPQDIAAAIGLCRPGLGRELVCRLWWPDGAALSPEVLDAQLRQAILAEWMRRARDLQVARLAVHIAEDDPRHRGQFHAAKSALTEAKARMWPSVGPTYRKIREAVLTELSGPRTCPECGGRGSVTVGSLMRACGRCEGRGSIPHTDTARAEACGVREDAYRKTWRHPYEWLHALCAGEELAARHELAGRLRQRDWVADRN